MMSKHIIISPNKLSQRIKRYPKEKIDRILSHVKLKTTPKNHQSRGLVVGLMKNKWLFALDPGLGKTKLALDVVTNRMLMGEIKKTLVVCPPIVINHWGNEVVKHSDLTSTLVVGNAKEKQKLFHSADKDITVVSLAWITRQLSAMYSDENALDKMMDSMSRYNCIIFDEVHMLKNAKSKGFRGFKDVINNLDIPFVYLLTGTPIGNDHTGVWPLYYLIDKGATYGADYYAFLRKWFNSRMANNRFLVYKLKSDKRAEFMDKFWNKVVRWEETECNDLPEKRHEVLTLEMTNEQKKAYKINLDDPESASKKRNKNESIFSLMRITAGIGMKESPKIEAVLNYTKEICVDMGHQLIVWHWLDKEGEMIYDESTRAFKKLNIGCVRGATSMNVKTKVLSDWRNKKLDLLIANTKSLGVGIDLFESNVCIFFSNNFSVIDRKQAEKRIHRTGQTRTCRYIDIVCSKSIDEIILNSLNKSKKQFNETTRDSWAWEDIKNKHKGAF